MYCLYNHLVSFFLSFYRFVIDEQTGRLTIIEAKRMDEGDIKCVAENRAGKVIKSAHLKVSFKIRIFFSDPELGFFYNL